ncbi:Uncharacterised protein [Serratia fonticola]|uniref:Uncharacterized protein n=1 Tax=Serratia fonticola TaxID=47917 RepID=A0A4U9TJA9_SERFO|nr:Uncharacterised protein [Serratia fonticola]
MLATLPSDIVLVKPSSLLNEPQQSGSGYVPPSKPHKPQPKNPFTGGIKQCKVKLPQEGVNASHALGIIAESVAQSPVVGGDQTPLAALDGFRVDQTIR